MNTFDPNDLPNVLGYAVVKGLGTVAILSEDVGGMTFVARWVSTSALKDRTEHFVDYPPEEKNNG
jgi:hypothetical protein